MYFLRRILSHNKCVFSSRGKKSWYPDAEWMEQCAGVFVTKDEFNSKFPPKPHCGTKRPPERQFRNMILNWGPIHPAAHGCLRLILELDGEIMRHAHPHIGLLHRGTEKLIEYKTYNQALPYFDRLDYLSPFANEHTFCLAAEKLLNIEVPRRAKYIRVLFDELMRLMNHICVVVFTALDVGAITPLFWLFEEREKIFEICERACGARMHANYVRIGGVNQDIPLGLLDDIYDLMRKYPERLDEFEDVISENRLFIERTKNIGTISAEEAINRGFSGPNLRSCGVKWDLRKNFPYAAYDELDFDVCIGVNGDVYDRVMVRLAEMRQTVRIIEQICNKMPPGEVKIDDNKISQPTRKEMKTSMEALIHHFKLYSQGFQVPPGSTYTAIEHPKGEFGVYLVADGSSIPYRCYIRTASFNHLSAMDFLCKNHFLADVVPILAALDVVFGDVDR